jgi:hypothetical protein
MSTSAAFPAALKIAAWTAAIDLKVGRLLAALEIFDHRLIVGADLGDLTLAHARAGEFCWACHQKAEDQHQIIGRRVDDARHHGPPVGQPPFCGGNLEGLAKPCARRQDTGTQGLFIDPLPGNNSPPKIMARMSWASSS